MQKNFAARLRLSRQCKTKVELCQFFQLSFWAILVLLVNGLRVVPFSAICRVSLAPRNVSNQVQGACPLWGQFFICKIKNGGLDNEKRSEAPVASAIAAGFLVDSG